MGLSNVRMHANKLLCARTPCTRACMRFTCANAYVHWQLRSDVIQICKERVQNHICAHSLRYTNICAAFSVFIVTILDIIVVSDIACNSPFLNNEHVALDFDDVRSFVLPYADSRYFMY